MKERMKEKINELIKTDSTGQLKEESDLLRCFIVVGIMVPGV
jgi:hypothetical protein